MFSSPLTEGTRGDIQPAMQRRLAQLHSAMGEDGTTTVAIGSAAGKQTPTPDSEAIVGVRVAPKTSSSTRSMVLMGGLMLAGLLTGVLSQHLSAATDVPERPPVGETLTALALPAASVPAAPAPAIQSSEDDAIRDALERWRLDWSRRDVPAYLAHYSTRFEPATGISREKWAAQRQQALLNRPAIRIEVRDLRIERTGPQEAQVRFSQTYLSGRYQEHEQPKTMRLLREDGGWRIAGEWQDTAPAQAQPKP